MTSAIQTVRSANDESTGWENCQAVWHPVQCQNNSEYCPMRWDKWTSDAMPELL